MRTTWPKYNIFGIDQRGKKKREKKPTKNVVPVLMLIFSLSLSLSPSLAFSLSLSLSLPLSLLFFSSSVYSLVVSHYRFTSFSLVVDVTYRESRKAQGVCD